MPNLTKTKENISIISFIPYWDTQEINLGLINLGNGSAYITNTIQSDLTLKQEVSFSQLSTTIDKSKIAISTVPVSIDAFGGTENIQWILYEKKYDEGTYTGILIVNGTNFKPISTNINVSYVVSPWFMVLMTMIGILIAICLGMWYSEKEAKRRINKEYLDSLDTVLHVNKIIFELNTIKQNIDSMKWRDITKIAQKHIDAIKLKMQEVKLNKENENVKWFEKIHNGLIINCCDGEGIVGSNRSIKLLNIDEFFELIEKKFPMFSVSFKEHTNKEGFSKETQDEIEGQKFVGFLKDFEKTKQKEKLDFAEKLSNETPAEREYKIIKLRQEINKKNINKSKWAYFSGTAIFTSLASIFVLDSFVGPLWLNIIIGIITGFSVYRTQDFAKIFKPDSIDKK
ncbi:hypothetical protein [Nitrosopumilus sp.]|uniref:hypothetical protein n=1 Tax=Nitrosopumilus sp. TaxID=2024843 RepID=UPI00247CAF8A|nr:hypothetical protein [Nitrosopumilus sp.]MCV0410769.1 hypothetical protein [Nitrosopumilus sp.]